MMVLDCDNKSVTFDRRQCPAPIRKAHLSRKGLPDVPLEHDEDTLEVSLTGDMPCQGVWQLILDTHCGCFSAPIYVDCPPPAIASTHYPTDDTPRPIESCCPLEEQTDLTEDAAVFKEPEWLSFEDGVAEGKIEGIPEDVTLFTQWRAYDKDYKEVGCAPVTLNLEEGEVELSGIETRRKPTWVELT